MSPDVFVLSRPHGVVRAAGVVRRYPDAAAAARDLRERRVDSVVGALAFDPREPSALIAPTALYHTRIPLPGAQPTARRLTAVVEIPDPATHLARVQAAVAAIADGGLDKVVLARALTGRLDAPADVDDLLAALAGGNHEHNAFAVDTGTGRLVGASPELLLRKHGREVTCLPYAGSAPRHADPAADRRSREALAGSAKDHREHAFVVEHLRRRLAPIATDLEIGGRPELLSTGEMWHLATPVHAVLTESDSTALDLAMTLSPTPATCGTPADVAARFIRTHEEPRGLYAGAVGWADADGNGEWMVTIRCLELDRTGTGVRMWAGGGIVAGSDPQAELTETTAKLQTVLNALGVTLDDLPAAGMTPGQS
ncbi:isochorismate synthase [Gordonia desulfuricans]|uniref:isochorismate synthase n=1 Tax=Gordonia desulfuricans TaxID=89051 RepID=A0A7K3LKR8_9ACTN|nr:isochorismate synthase [Gordonia desulfuricans]NDK88137.1 isochorismate synthase [Gordonia desulfuricans]